MPLDPSALRRAAPDRVVSAVRIDATPTAVEVESDGARLLHAGTADLLGLGVDPRVREALQGTLRRLGVGAAGPTKTLEEVEARLAGLLSTEAAAVLDEPGAVASCLEALSVVVDPPGRAHRTNGLAVATPEDAERALALAAGAPLVVDAVDEHTGELAPLHRYAEVTQRVQASLVVLDRLGLGVLGPAGLGAADALGLSDQAALQLFHLGGAIPGAGVVLAGPRAVVDALRPCGQPPPAALLAATSRALQLATAEAPRRVRAFDVAQALLEGLRRLGLDTGPCVTPWIPVWMGDEALADQWLKALADAGVATRALLAGTRSRLLVSLAATATDAQVTAVLDAFAKVARKLKPVEVAAAWRGPVLLARPGSFALSTPCAPHWKEPTSPEAPPAPATTPEPPPAERLRDRLFDAVETLTWRVTNRRGGKLGLPGGEALKALLDRRRR